MKKIILLAGLSLLLLVGMVAPAQGQWTIDLQAGDWFKYEGNLLNWTSEEGFEFPPSFAGYLQTYNESDWIMYTVTDVSIQDLVNWTVVTHWSNGTETTADMVENVTSSSDIMVIGANMTEGDLIRPADFLAGDRILNASIMLDSPNGTREMNVLNYASEFFGSTYGHEYYWDALTGIQVLHWMDANASDFMSGATYNYTATFTLIESSTGQVIPDLTGPLLLLATMSITAPIALLLRRKKRVI